MMEKSYDALTLAKYEQLLGEVNSERDRRCTDCETKVTHLFVCDMQDISEENEKLTREVTFSWRCDNCGEHACVATFQF